MFNKKLKEEVKELKNRVSELEEEKQQREVGTFFKELESKYKISLCKTREWLMFRTEYFISINGSEKGIFNKTYNDWVNCNKSYNQEILENKGEIGQQLKAYLYDHKPTKKVGRPRKSVK